MQIHISIYNCNNRPTPICNITPFTCPDYNRIHMSHINRKFSRLSYSLKNNSIPQDYISVCISHCAFKTNNSPHTTSSFAIHSPFLSTQRTQNVSISMFLLKITTPKCNVGETESERGSRQGGEFKSYKKTKSTSDPQIKVICLS